MTTPESRAAALLGRKGGLKGGLSKSEAKVRAARENGKKNKPKKTDPNAWVDSLPEQRGFTPEEAAEVLEASRENGKKGGRPRKESSNANR